MIVERRARPGGHWNDAYDFVTLHQPAAFYGVGSHALGSGGGDLVSKAQILAYCERVMEALLATGLGLLAAIPAVIFYNKLSSDSDRIISNYESFADEFATLLSRQLDQN